VLGEGHLEERAETLHASLLAQAARDGFFVKSDQSHEVDAALLWLCAPLGVVEANEPHFAETLGRVAASLELEGGVRRYAGDTYYGGGAWPVLTASLGLCYAAGGDEAGARRCLAWVGDRVDAGGRLAEQYGGEKRDPADYRLWVQRWGPPAADLVWSHAMHVALAAELAGPDEAALEVAEGEH
jgi:GH15 family glucan-1,4-alpha-glucosidase